MAFNLTPQSLGLLMGGLNMMAASRGGNPDLTKGGLGYALQQGLQGGLQGVQLGKQFQQGEQKQKMLDDMLMKLNLDPTAMQSTGVLRPGVQQSALTKLTPEQKEVVKMAIMSGDWKSVMGMIGPIEPAKPTSLMQNAAAIGLVPGTPEYAEFMRSAILKPDTVISMDRNIKPPAGYMIDPDDPTRVKKIPGSEFSQAELKTAGFANRMAKADEILGSIVEGGYDPTSITDKLAGSMGGVGNMLRSQEGQMFRQGQEDWVRAKLRLESGAVIGAEEMADEIKTYFPQVGDSQKVIEQKARARQTAIDNLIKESQGAYEAKFKPIQKAPKGVPPEVWAVMTPEERAAWQ